MSDKPIATGDLVRVVKWPCCGHFVGVTRLVTGIASNVLGIRCTVCGATNLRVGAVGSDKSVPSGDNRLCSFPIAWVKRIDPPAIPESTETDLALTV